MPPVNLMTSKCGSEPKFCSYSCIVCFHGCIHLPTVDIGKKREASKCKMHAESDTHGKNVCRRQDVMQFTYALHDKIVHLHLKSDAERLKPRRESAAFFTIAVS